jgi:hypothetical protein
MQVQQSTKLIFSVVIALAILSAVVTTAGISNIRPSPAQSDGFATPAAAVTATAIAGPSSSSTSSSGKVFSTRLTGDNEVPPVDTAATGRITLSGNSQENALDYQLSLSNLNGIVTSAHVHRGNVGTNGPIVANLKVVGAFAGASASASGGEGSAMTSTSTGGTITAADLKGPLAGKQVSDLIKLIEDGKAYVNVHTDQNPDGEIRGQLKAAALNSVESSTSTGTSASASTSPSASASATAP